MKYIDGKFFDAEGNIVPVKFGDKEQIELLKRNTENTKRLTKGTYAAHIDEEYFEDS
jgi:hypothetical protein